MPKMPYKTIFSIAAIMSLRMLGLFMVMPLLALYTMNLSGTTPFLLGFAMGAYGLTQACLQMPLGIISDFQGRKVIILLGLLIFIAGSLIAAFAHSIFLLILGRTLQGAGAIGSTLMALLSDLTNENHRAQSMAIIGGVIGISFSLALVLGPILNAWLNVPHIFLLSAAMGIIAIIVLLTTIPQPKTPATEAFSLRLTLSGLKQLCLDKKILWINLSAMMLHAILIMNFISTPISLHTYGHISQNHQWWVYLPVLLLSFAIALKWIMLSEQKKSTRFFSILSIGLITSSQIWLLFFYHSLWGISIGLFLFFLGFNFLEAVLPSEISKQANIKQRGMAMGFYSTIQFMGIFLGGLLGGIIFSYFSIAGIFVLCAIISIIWLIVSSQQLLFYHQK